MSRFEPDAREADASRLMLEGLRFLHDTDARPREALICFDAALTIRRTLPMAASRRVRYGLAAACLNRAEALLRLGGREQATAAVESIDEAIALLTDLPLDEDVRIVRRLAIAHHNRALALEARDPASVTAILAAFDAALHVLTHPSAARLTDRVVLESRVWANVARVRASDDRPEAHTHARAAAYRALGMVDQLEVTDVAAAETGLTARHALCRTLATRLADASTRTPDHDDDLHEATDIVERALQVASEWAARGERRLQPLAAALYAFGATLYRRYQPQFLDEFVAEHHDATLAETVADQPDASG